MLNIIVKRAYAQIMSDMVMLTHFYYPQLKKRKKKRKKRKKKLTRELTIQSLVI